MSGIEPLTYALRKRSESPSEHSETFRLNPEILQKTQKDQYHPHSLLSQIFQELADKFCQHLNESVHFCCRSLAD